ncbi:hypothetical protein [Streptomyces sp. NBC_00316]|uniref:hypothetical protein n=1 Tax=Streptomyces sp. NBC_00316 TaxID=2975710 RepID=UPI002E2BBBED|nr:hypothetical protein [Streptomyces sp. NBC_00316]
MMRQHLKLSAVLVVVVLALTGFSTSTHSGRSRGSKSHGSSSGGGCSTSKKSNGGYHQSTYDDDDYDSDYDSSSSSSGGSTYETATPAAAAGNAPRATVIRCVQPRKGKRRAVTSSTVQVSVQDSGTYTYEVDVTFLDASGNTVDTGEADVELSGDGSATVSVRMHNPSKVSRVKKCRAVAELKP